MTPTRRGFLGSLTAPFLHAQRSARPPNILLIMADDLGAGELGCYGNRQNRTPNLDSLAGAGVRFETCYATPLCSPSRVELMTGRYAFRTGWYNLIGRPFAPADRVSPDEITFADVLKQRGYRTGLAGKWQLGLVGKHPTTIHDSGFDEYFAWAWQQGGLPPDARFDASERNRYWHPAIVENGKHVPARPDQYGPDLYSNWIADFMKRHRDRPFLAYYPMCLVHEPWDPTPDPAHPGGRTAGGLRSCVEYMDHVVGRLLRGLDELGLRDNTIVMFTGDNGTGKAGKGTVTEAGVRVPMIVNHRALRSGVVARQLIDFSDVMPTLAELAAAPLPKGVQIDGRSFAWVLRGENGKPRDWVFSYLQNRRMLRDGRWLLEGDGRFFDCGDHRNGQGYREVTDSAEPEVRAARERFDRVLAGLPAPQGEAPPRERGRKRARQKA